MIEFILRVIEPNTFDRWRKRSSITVECICMLCKWTHKKCFKRNFFHLVNIKRAEKKSLSSHKRIIRSNCFAQSFQIWSASVYYCLKSIFLFIFCFIFCFGFIHLKLILHYYYRKQLVSHIITTIIN